MTSERDPAPIAAAMRLWTMPARRIMNPSAIRPRSGTAIFFYRRHRLSIYRVRPVSVCHRRDGVAEVVRRGIIRRSPEMEVDVDQAFGRCQKTLIAQQVTTATRHHNET